MQHGTQLSYQPLTLTTIYPMAPCRMVWQDGIPVLYPISHTHKASSQVLCWTCCISCPQLPKRQLACCMPGGQGFSNTTTIQVPGRRGSSTSAPRRCRRYRTRGLSRMPLGKDTTGFRRLFSAYKVKLCSSIVKPPDGNSQEALTTTGNQVNRHGHHDPTHARRF